MGATPGLPAPPTPASLWPPGPFGPIQRLGAALGCQRDVASRTAVVCSPATLITTPNSLPAPGPTHLPSLLDLGAEPSPCLCLAVSPPLSFSNRHLCTAAPRTPAPLPTPWTVPQATDAARSRGPRRQRSHGTKRQVRLPATGGTPDLVRRCQQLRFPGRLIQTILPSITFTALPRKTLHLAKTCSPSGRHQGPQLVQSQKQGEPQGHRTSLLRPEAGGREGRGMELSFTACFHGQTARSRRSGRCAHQTGRPGAGDHRLGRGRQRILDQASKLSTHEDLRQLKEHRTSDQRDRPNVTEGTEAGRA